MTARGIKKHNDVVEKKKKNFIFMGPWDNSGMKKKCVLMKNI